MGRVYPSRVHDFEGVAYGTNLAGRRGWTLGNRSLMRLSRQARFDALRAFDIAGRHLSFKAAVDALSVTPSAISHRIRDLEHHLG